jgi:chromosome segregation protein
MRLSGLNIKGFKSFARETNIQFNERVTGIIGPNGSGKSNIVDAIRWVLGEQKPTELRLDNMPDVIFNGTKSVKKGSLAHVTLNFDNTKNILSSDYSNVSITRTLFSSGESEYKLNDIPCRLKDIRNLFIDTGVGPDSYAIIALNMVEDILSDNNDSRRFMFEQAAGISKFKKRKKETLQQLQLTKADLERVQDLLFEIENNLKELEKQARRAKQFLTIKNQYKDLSVQLNLLKYDNFDDSYHELGKNIEQELSTYREADLQILTLEAKLQELKSKIIVHDKDLSDAQKKINNLLNQIRNIENEKQMLNQKLGFNSIKKSEIDKEIADYNAKIGILNSKLKNTTDRIEEERINLNKKNAEFQLFDEVHKVLKNEFDQEKIKLDENNRIKKELEDKKFALQKNIAVSNSKIESFLKDIDIRNEKLKSLRLERESLTADKLSISGQLAITEKRVTELQSVKIDKARIKESVENAIKKLYEEFNQLSRQSDSKKNEFRLIKNMIDKLEGFPESIKYLNKNWNENIPLLTDIISTSDKYKIAIETFLEPYLNYFVVNDKFEALEAINLLRKAQKGKANFFILENIKSAEKKSFEIPHYIKAIDVVNFDNKYEKLVAKLFHNVFISPADMDETSLHEDAVVIDKTGSLIAGQMKISGGSIGLFEGKKIGRKKSLDDLNDAINELDKKIIEIEKEIEDRNIELKSIDNQESDSDLDKYSLEFQKLKNQLSQSDYKTQLNVNQEDALNNELLNIESNLEKIRIELSSDQNSITEIETAFTSYTNPDVESRTDIDVVLTKLSDASAKSNNAKIELLKQENLISVLEKDLAYLKSEIDMLDNKYKDNSDSLIKIEAENDGIGIQLGLSEKELISNYTVKTELEKQLDDLEKNYFEHRNEISKIESQITEKKHQINKSQYLINQLKEKQLDLEYNKKAISDRLKIEFNLDLKELLHLERIEEDELSLNDKVEKLRYKLDNFGEVNTLAIEAFNEMKLRHEKIESQKKDVLDAEKSLKQTINEIEKTATEMFLNSFEIIRGHFKKVFTTLFTEGDTCDIRLENPESPLDSKILVTARPKGKRPKSISQLSGGEKTLTAIALLFSLYLYKPAPFCIFDEVDAPLDDANIMKFNNIIREFSENSQFIVVTHNKTTMTAVDVLYGVFMQEQGISEVAEVDFREFEIN